MFEFGKDGPKPLEEGNPLLEGMRITIQRDPEDRRYDIITVRRIGNVVVGGPPRPECDLTGKAALRRWVRMVIGEAMGHVLDNKQARRALEAVWKRFQDPA